ncbi:MAG: SPOR domain-containing protein [Flavobacteriales bacterium]|nr:SPOR domain-containing protein [Flavobacteriales bacterium]
MLIDKYIENALYLYQCVIVPGFGGFLAIESPSSQDTTSGKRTPEGKKFSFNPALRVNDGVLASYIANMRDVSYAEALLEISHAVDFYLSRLAKGDSVDIAGVGMIKPSDDGQWVFSPYGEKSFSRENYGLESSVPSPEEKKTTEEEKTETFYADEQTAPVVTATSEPSKAAENTDVEQEEEEIQEEVTPEETIAELTEEKVEEITAEKISNTENDDEKPHTGRTGRIIWISLVCVFAVLCVAIYALWGHINTFFETEEKEIKTEVVTPVIPVVQDSTDIVDTVKADTVMAQKVVTDLDSMVADKVFYVVAASLSKKQSAENEIKRLRENGFPAVYAGRQNGLYMVAYNGYDDRKEATEFLDSIINTKNHDAWIKVYDANKKK